MVTKWLAGVEIDLVRNPSWNPRADPRPAYLKSITIKEGYTDMALEASGALAGSRLICCDGSPPTSVVALAIAHDPGPARGNPIPRYRWIALNTRSRR
jgi:hypothetical protein